MVNKLAQCKKLIAESEKGFLRPTISHYRDKENGMTTKEAIQQTATNFAKELWKKADKQTSQENNADFNRRAKILAAVYGITYLQAQHQIALAQKRTIPKRLKINPSTKTTIKKTVNPNKEFIIWGKPPKSNDEQVLHTKSKTLTEAKNFCNILETKHGCKDTRIQVLDLTNGFSQDFRKLAKRKNPSTKTTIKKTFTKRTVIKNPSALLEKVKLRTGNGARPIALESFTLNEQRQILSKPNQYEVSDGYVYLIKTRNSSTKTATKTRANYSNFDFDFDKQFDKLSKMFQGKTNGEKRKILASDLQPNKTVRIGELKKLIVNGLDGKQYEINFDGEAFASMDRRKGLWFSGKDSQLQLRNNNIKNDEMKCLGHLAQINYVTKKAHIENGEIVEYYHKFGEVNREKPTIWCDADGFLIVNGGDYDIWKEGIVN